MISSLYRGLAILELMVAEGRPMRLAEIADALPGSKSGLHALLATLVKCGYVERLAGGVYQLGMKAWRLGAAFPTIDLVRIARSRMELLVRQVREGAILGVLSGTDAVYVDLVEAKQAVRVHAEVGDRIPAHSTSVGLALLAFQPPELLKQILPQQLDALSPHTIVDKDILMDELGRVRLRGYSINRGGWNAEVGGIAAPIFDQRDKVVAALCVALPLFRMTPNWIRNTAPALVGAASTISRELGAPAASGAYAR